MRRRAAVAAALAALLCGCTDSDVIEVSRSDQAAPPSASPTPPAAAPTSEPTGSPSASNSTPDSSPQDCDDADRGGIEAAISGQLAAFGQGDYAAAREFATDGFRAGVDLERFREIIDEGFPVVRDNTGHETGRCLTDGPFGSAVVTVTAGDGEEQVLAYLMERDDQDTWRIAGARPLQPAAPDTPTPGVV